MFVQQSIEVALPVEVVERVLTDSDRPSVWARAAYRRGERLAIGPGVPAVAVELDVGEPLRSNGAVTIPIGWRALGGSRLFPHMEAELVLDSVGTNRTQLTFRGSYRPPLAALGAMLDKLAMHKVAEATVRNFLERLASALPDHALQAELGLDHVLQAEPGDESGAGAR